MRKILLGILAGAALVTGAAVLAQAPPPVPALPDVERRTTYSLSAQTGPLSVGFALYGDGSDFGNWLQVYVNGVLQDPASYLITSPTGTLATLPRPITDAQLTFVSATTGTVQVVGARRPRRTSQFNENRGVTARDLNQVLSDITAMEREIWDLKARLAQVPPGETLTMLPPLASRASQGAGFDSMGNLTAMAFPGGATPISVAMAPVVAASTVAIARTLLGVPDTASAPIGMEVDWPGFTAPSKWLFEYGQEVNRSDYPELLNVLAPTIPVIVTMGSTAVTGIPNTESFPATGMRFECATFQYILTVTGPNTGTLNTNAVLGCTTARIYPYGNGNGTSTFNIPDGRNLVYVGRSDMGSFVRTVPPLDTTFYINGDPRTLGSVGGSQSLALAPANLPPHTHGLSTVFTANPTVQHTHDLLLNHTSIAYQGGATTADVWVATGGAGLGHASAFENVPHIHTLIGSTDSTGSSLSVSIVQPSGIRNKIIYAGH